MAEEARINGITFYAPGIASEDVPAWKSGIAARFEGADFDQCPHYRTEERRRAWNVGWNDADNRLRIEKTQKEQWGRR